MRFQAPRGTHDVLPGDSFRWRFVEETFREVCRRFGYAEIRTPTFEDTQLFLRGIGEGSEIVVDKQMYSFNDPGGDSLTLRPEGTAPAVRAFLENSLHAQGPVTKVFYTGPIFRYERPQSGRLREHHQCGIELFGSIDPAADAEVIQLGVRYLRSLDIRGEEIHINSVGCPACRPAYLQVLRRYVKPHLSEMCGNCQRRYEANPLRILDCKVDVCRAATADAPPMHDSLCGECSDHLTGCREVLDLYGIECVLDDRLVRGLDYYTKTAFEFLHGGLGAQSAVLSGGRYDGLVEECGGSPTPGVGFGSGVERVLLAMEAEQSQPVAPEPITAFVITLGDAARKAGLKLLADLRAVGLAADTDYAGRSMKAQMKEANRCGARYAVIIGEDEVAHNAATVKDLATSEQASVRMESLVGSLVE
ncbi:MAG: histidine--tRNA ligase [Armatimonadetes bacterium CG2_30_59_28]|nr:MAG: histidine--tRNA ligase [Armatimonadetes bacterium CG2_30_59_28]PIU63168.1 MAG: histidine--tRNA ligase [Armatimonadetes bacterium CG07_land_8_20_14_0_80_59_28]PIY49435.1 MAG: histidine--tRNA ligase [Armatimonadetes bacterium CG_4_10_14_3_um_filter_59_10]PJB76490.1 MAG: histidine--tRNA ligase [Armatimonadetes bacterium CG_4_9_14_3_um_filter_58_7]